MSKLKRAFAHAKSAAKSGCESISAAFTSNGDRERTGSLVSQETPSVSSELYDSDRELHEVLLRSLQDRQATPAELTTEAAACKPPTRVAHPTLLQAYDEHGDSGGSTNTANASILVCDLCHLSKLYVEAGLGSLQYAGDFPSVSQPTLCCLKNICATCYLSGVLASLSENWWTQLDEPNWVTCPNPRCDYNAIEDHTPEVLLRSLGDNEVERSMDIYHRATALRTVLSGLHLDDESLCIARELHEYLFSVGKMDSPFDPKFSTIATLDGDGISLPAPFDPGPVKMIFLNSRDIGIPLFTSFLRRQHHGLGKECAFCTEKIFDIEIESVEEWVNLCSSFYGDGMWNVLQFPLKLKVPCLENPNSAEYCRHDIDFCTDCLQRHLKSQLEEHGAVGSSRLTCPGQSCHRLLTPAEIQLYADEDTFKKYAKYRLLDVLSQEPTFRWCLRQGCSNGALHDVDDDPQISCDECGFLMCYDHCVPWHENQTCEQYTSLQEHGDTDYKKTREWIDRFTKQCPGCTQNIQKGDLCFHMTCRQCRFEFCWECLADWKQISPTPGQHIVNGHRPECPFRINRVNPSHITGEAFAEAMR